MRISNDNGRQWNKEEFKKREQSTYACVQPRGPGLRACMREHLRDQACVRTYASLGANVCACLLACTCVSCTYVSSRACVRTPARACVPASMCVRACM